MIDKLEVAVDPEVPLNAQFESGYRRMRKFPDKIYKEKASIRPLGVNAILFRYCRFNASHRISMVGVSRMTIEDVAVAVAKVFDCSPWGLRLARVDFAIDLRSIEMDWIRAHVRVPRKRWKDERGFDKGSDGLERGKTLYIGSWADCFRFYDKEAQLIGQSGAVAPELNRPAVYGPLTRIERQLGTGRIPAAISTLAKLSRNARAFNPFAPLSFATGGKVEPRIEDYSPRTILEGTGLRTWIETHGFAKTWEMLNAVSRGNARRIIRRLADFIPSDPQGLEIPDLFAMHREGLGFQLGEAV